MDSGASAGCSGSGDCEGEEQEDPSSSSLYDGEGCDANTTEHDKNAQKNSNEDQLFAFCQQWQKELEQSDTPLEEEKSAEAEFPVEPEKVRSSVVTAQEVEEDELAVFRQQWQHELEATTTRRAPAAPADDVEPATDDEKAKKYFLLGVELERSGKWYEAIQQYKRAMAIVPDIERRLYEATKGMDTPQEEEETIEEEPVNTNTDDEEDEDAVEGEPVVAKLLRLQARRGLMITPSVITRGGHISSLPYEVILAVLRWVVSGDLDCASLERVGATCRALHIAARDPDLWRCVCVRTWGVESGTPRAHGLPSWRDMYIYRARLQLHGCYISKTTYLRHGENSFQEHFYRPWYLIDYYRYLRFFPDGLVLMWTTAEEPAACVQQLRWRTARPALGILAGHYRLIGDKVVIVIKKSSSEKKQTQPSNTRFRSRRKDAEQEQTQTFHMELELRSVRGRRNAVLSWLRYRTCRRDVWTHFDLTPKAFPPFAFSRVRAYTREAQTSL